MPIEIFDRRVDPESGKYFDEITSSKASYELKEAGYLQELQGGQFLGLPKNEDPVTKILISKEDLLRDKLNRQVVFGLDNKPILNVGDASELGLEGLDSDESEEEKKEGDSSEDQVEKIRMELAMDKQQQARLHKELDIPEFDKNERVEVNDEDVSEDESELGDDDAKNREKSEQY